MQKVKTAREAGGRRKTKGRALPFLYVLFWSFAGAASVAYLGVIFTDPDLVNALSTPASTNSPSSLFTDEQVASPAARALSDRLSNAKVELSKLRTELNEHKQAYAEGEPQEVAPSEAVPTTSADDDRVPAEPQMTAANETAPVPVVPGVVIPGLSIVDLATQHPGMPHPNMPMTTAAPEQPSPPSSVSEVAIVNTTIVNGSNAGSPIETGALPVVPPPAPGVRPKPKPVAVVAISKPKPAAQPQAAPTKAAAPPTGPTSQVVAFGPATVTRAPKTVETPKIGVRLATAPTLDALRLTWNAMRERHGDALKGLSPRYVKESVSSTGPYALVAGPVAKSTDVLEICAGLGGEVRECALATFEGRSL